MDIVFKNKKIDKLSVPKTFSQRIWCRQRFLDENMLDDQAIAKFASEIGIAAGIIVDRLHHEGGLSYKRGNDLRQRIDWDNFLKQRQYMGTIVFDFLVDSFLFKTSLIESRYKNIPDKVILNELLSYRQFCIDNLGKVQQEVKENDSLRIFSGMEMPTTALLKQSAFYIGQYIIDDPIFKLTYPSRDVDKAVNEFLKVETQTIDRDRLSNAAFYMKNLTPMVMANYVKFLPVSYLFEPSEEIPILTSDCGFSDSLPESLINFFTKNAIIKSVDIVGSNRTSRFINLKSPKPCREIMIQFKNHVNTGYGYILLETIPSQESQVDSQSEWGMYLPSEAPNLEEFEAWVDQSFYLSSKKLYQKVLQKNIFATELGAYYLSESQFVFDLLSQHFPLKETSIKQSTTNILMSLDKLPFLEEIDISTLMNVRMEYGDEFQNFRLNLEKHLREFRLIRSPDELKIKVDNALHEIYEVQVSQINSRLKQIKRTALIADSVILLGSLIGAFQTGGGTIPALAGIAATVARGVKPFFEYENQIRQNPAFFIWKALDESKRFTWAD